MSSTFGAEDFDGSEIRIGEESGDELAVSASASVAVVGGFLGGGEMVSSISSSV